MDKGVAKIKLSYTQWCALNCVFKDKWYDRPKRSSIATSGKLKDLGLIEFSSDKLKYVITELGKKLIESSLPKYLK